MNIRQVSAGPFSKDGRLGSQLESPFATLIESWISAAFFCVVKVEIQRREWLGWCDNVDNVLCD